jgi:hypothetical protein
MLKYLHMILVPLLKLIKNSGIRLNLLRSAEIFLCQLKCQSYSDYRLVLYFLSMKNNEAQQESSS